MPNIYHITTREEWEQALKKGFYEAESLHSEGFIHCSTDQQVEGVLRRYFSGKKNLVKLVIDPEKLKSPLHYELAPSVNEEFPHIYGPLEVEAVEEVKPISESQ